MIYGYIRVTSDKQTVENQCFEINKFCEREWLDRRNHLWHKILQQTPIRHTTQTSQKRRPHHLCRTITLRAQSIYDNGKTANLKGKLHSYISSQQLTKKQRDKLGSKNWLFDNPLCLYFITSSNIYFIKDASFIGCTLFCFKTLYIFTTKSSYIVISYCLKY